MFSTFPMNGVQPFCQVPLLSWCSGAALAPAADPGCAEPFYCIPAHIWSWPFAFLCFRTLKMFNSFQLLSLSRTYGQEDGQVGRWAGICGQVGRWAGGQVSGWAGEQVGRWAGRWAGGQWAGEQVGRHESCVWGVWPGRRMDRHVKGQPSKQAAGTGSQKDWRFVGDLFPEEKVWNSFPEEICSLRKKICFRWCTAGV